MFAARLHAYEPDGASLGYLPTPSQASVGTPHNDRGSMTLTYSNLAIGGPLVERALGVGLEVALEVEDRSGAWVEPRGCRFLHIERNRNRKDAAGMVALTMPSYGWLLGQARVLTGPFYGPEHAQAGKRGFEGKTAGFILVTLLAENAALDGVPVTPVFTAVNDSAGNAWPVLENIAFDEGTTLSAVLDTLVQAGALDWRTQARGLYAWAADSPALSPDLSGIDGVQVDMEWLTSAPEQETLEGMVGRLALATDAGGRVQVTDPATPSPWGVWQGYMQIGSVADESAATAVAEAELERTSRPRGQYTRDYQIIDATAWPLIDFGSGAWVAAPGAGGAMESLRVQDINLTLASDGSWAASLILNDRILDADLRRARNLSALLGGGSVSPSGPPSSTDPEASRVPSTPTGLDTVASVVFQGPTPRGVVTASWIAVTTATDDGPLAISGYELQHRIGAGDWQTNFTPEVSAQIGNLTPGDTLSSRVRAVGARTVLPSAWSAIDSVVVPGDVTAPPVPTAPTIVSALKIVSVTWAGALAAAIPADFLRVDVAVGTSSTPTTVRGALTRGGTLQVTAQTLGVAIGDTVWARLRSVDTTGNPSVYSAAVSVVVAGVAGPDLEANSVTANTIAVGALDSKLITGATIRTSAANPRVEMDATGLYAYNAAGTQTISIVGGTATITGGTITGATVRTAASGARADMAGLTGGGGFWARDSTGAARATMQVSDTVSPGIYLWDSAGVARVFLYTSGTQSVMSFRNPANAEVMKITDGQIKIFTGGSFIAEHPNGQVALQAGPIGSSWGLLVNKDNGNPVMRVYQTSGDSGRIYVGHENQNILTMQVWSTSVWFGQNPGTPGTGTAMSDFVINTDEFYLYNAGGTLIHAYRTSGSTRLALGDTSDPLANFWLYAAASQIRNHNTLFFIDGSDVTTGSINRAGAGALAVAGGNGATLTLGAGANFVSANGNTVTLDNTNLRSATVYSNTTSGAANVVVVTTSGVLMRSTSLRAAKLDVEDAPDAWADVALALRPRTWLDRGNVERYADALARQDEGELVDWALEPILRIDERIPGFVAEEVIEAGGDVFITRDETGAASGLAYERLTAALVALAQRHHQQIDSLTTRITTLEGTNP